MGELHGGEEARGKREGGEDYDAVSLISYLIE